MRRMQLCRLEEESTSRILDKYQANSQADRLTDIRLYMDYRFGSFSAVELASQEHLSRYTVYRKIRRVNDFLLEQCGDSI